jgi:hypothetical protein
VLGFYIILYFQSSIKAYINISFIHFITVFGNILFLHFFIQKSGKAMLKLHLLSLLPMFYFHSYLYMLSHLLWLLHFDGKVIVLFYTVHMVLSPRVYMYVLCIKNSPGHAWFLLWRSNVNHICPMSCKSEARKTWKRENTMYYSLVLGYSININPVMLEFYCSFAPLIEELLFQDIDV